MNSYPNVKDGISHLPRLGQTAGTAATAANLFLSYNQLAKRLGLQDMQAFRIMRQLAIYGLIEAGPKGKRRAAGEKPEAGGYRWMLA